jgi:release factor glutamine methyltransferase
MPPPDVVERLRAAGCVFAEDEARLLTGTAGSPAELEDLVARRVSGVPLEQVLGWADFCGLRITMRPGVFVPRRRTELLARRAARLAGPTATVLDLCCGSGAVAAVLLTREPTRRVYAVDIDPVATACARSNVESRGGAVLTGDLYGPLPSSLRGRVDVVVANAPYVPTDAIGQMPPEARLHEPRVALDGGADGLSVQRRLVDGAPDWLARGGHLLVETSADQAGQTAALFDRSGFTARIARSAALEATVVIGTLAP